MAENASSQTQELQPEPKRQKMSTTTDDDEQNHENPESIPQKPKYRRRKVAIFFAYCGVGYQGMQKNPGAKTIEGDFEEALFLSGAVPEEERGKPRRYDWARSARTDKGVSAVGQVVSGKFWVDPPGFIERLNSNLVPQIRVFGYKRATPAFNSKKFCDRRRYVYLIPVFALDPTRHRDRESVLASLGSGNELVKCLECSERGRKVYGLMGKRSHESKTVGDNVEVGSGISSNSLGALVENEKADDVLVENNNSVNSLEKRNNHAPNENVSSENGAEKMKEDKTEDDKVVGVKTNGVKNVEKMKEDKTECENANDEEKPEKMSDFVYGDEEKERFNRILKYYEGTHNFHNFTTRTKAEDPAAKRYILSFNANTVISIDGFDFVKCEVVGQSFMLHQIRKMIGLAVAIMRNYAPESLIEKAFQQKVNITVPMAPEVGLYLDECFFPSYNQKWKDSHEELSMKDYVNEAEEFKMKYIYSHIAATENKEGSIAVWLHSLNYRNYPDLQFVDDGPSCEGQGNEAVDSCQVPDVKNDEIKNMDE
ncbi:hypothetical protein CASFOL_016018 [Castilleja foliolosa]|uniref:Pseudouridine synthase I TruA alpha/beta domain-containing protein n=1 Tax=Castilleja foliolosa TaxID=1961234 RepID=A0ABD3DJL6_9LAMI